MNPYMYAAREIRRRKYRTLVNVAGFVIAVAALITLVTAARGWEASTAAPMKAIGTDVIVIYSAPVAPSQGGCYIANHLFAYPFNQTSISQIADVSGVERAVPILMHRMQAVVFTGIDPGETETNAVLPTAVVEGRYLTPDDGYVVLVDREYAQINNLTIGSTTKYVQKSFEVVGIVDVGATDLIKSHIYVNLPVAQEAIPSCNQGEVNVALIRADDPRNIEFTAEALTNELPSATAITSSDMAATASGVLNIGETTAWNISIILAVVAILFTIKSQAGAVAERTREIGILKAIGWSNSNVVNQIVIESALQGIIGGILGCVLGAGFAWYVLYTIGGSFAAIDPLIIAIGFGVAVIGGIAAGLYPSWRAARLTPAEALKSM
jgi:putative ABC transport system permease protein